MPGDVPLGGPGRAGPSPVFGATFDRRPPPSGTRAGGPGRLGDAARGRVRARRPRPVSAPSQPRHAAVTHGPGGRYLRPLGLPAPVRVAYLWHCLDRPALAGGGRSDSRHCSCARGTRRLRRPGQAGRLRRPRRPGHTAGQSHRRAAQAPGKRAGRAVRRPAGRPPERGDFSLAERAAGLGDPRALRDIDREGDRRGRRSDRRRGGAGSRVDYFCDRAGDCQSATRMTGGRFPASFLWGTATAGGWDAPGTAEYFARFAERITDALGDLARYWITINEPTVIAYQGYVRGEWPPGRRDLGAAVRVLATLLRGHWLAYERIKRRRPELQVGLAHHLRVFDPARWFAPQDRVGRRLRPRI